MDGVSDTPFRYAVVKSKAKRFQEHTSSGEVQFRSPPDLITHAVDSSRAVLLDGSAHVLSCSSAHHLCCAVV